MNRADVMKVIESDYGRTVFTALGEFPPRQHQIVAFNTGQSYRQDLSAEAKLAWYAIGQGMVLRVWHDPVSCSLIDGCRCEEQIIRPDIPISAAVAQELIASGVLWKLTEERIGNRTGYREGWKDAGLDGTVADFWVCLQ